MNEEVENELIEPDEESEYGSVEAARKWGVPRERVLQWMQQALESKLSEVRGYPVKAEMLSPEEEEE